MGRYDVPPESPFAFLDDDQVRAWYAFMKVHLRLRYEMNHQLQADADVSLADYDVLVALTSDQDGRMTVSDLATRIGAERSRVSHQVLRMAGRNLVEVTPNARDRRAKDVTLTAEGRALLGRASPGHIAFVRSVFLDALSDAQTRQLAGAFEGIYDRLVEHGTLPRPADHP
ncbi:MarR family winged helix-turn-helix transcriptional regulator [Promicromonospora sukumoe]|uniref:DNA-binding MarR family transcriptional regulator n=1 Tax=Promicromonospora sukumoe TaxID=88382 RepID=A0A7W3J6Z9_9MICO|nr:MarR family transcriptional regulator [Promicromonospora sukumoe]MBA8807319.1 DNA-binding MarR family transcriptional regulator [Promicromonospora sukumoe]